VWRRRGRILPAGRTATSEASGVARTGKHRPHKPAELGPRLTRRGRYWTADMRPWGGSQYQTIRNPKDPGWPSSGERTEDRDTAESWKWDLVALYRGEARDRQRGVERAPPLGEKLDEYIRHRERTRAPTTVSSNNAALQALLQKFGEGKPVDRITTKGLQTLFDDMQAQGYAPSTMRTNLASMSTFFNWLGIDNPTKGVELPSDDDTEDIYAWSDADLTRLRNAADRLGYRQWFELALNTGTRKN